MFVVLSLMLAAGNPQAGTYDAAVQRAQREGLPLVVVFTDPAICPPCRTYEATLNDASLQAECVLLKVKTTQYPRLAQMLGVTAIPTTCVCGPDLKGVTTLSGALDRATLRAAIQRARK